MKLTKMTGIILGSFLAVSAFAADVTGKWTGKINVDMSKVMAMMQKRMAQATPEQKKQVEAGMKMASDMLKNSKLDLTLNKNGSYVMKTPAMMQSPAKEDKGTWKVTGNKITLMDPKAGKNGMKELVGTVSADGKTITFDVSTQAQAQAKKQGAKDEIPKTVMTFKRG